MKYNKISYSVILIFILVAITLLFNFSTFDKNINSDYKNEFKEKYNVYALELPKKLDFAEEEVPLHNFDVRESLDQELLINTYWQSQTLLFIKRANRFFPLIEPILKENNIPDDFKYLAIAESGLKNAVSPSGAKGYWQFLKGTGKEFGLIINDEVDERYNLEKSTIAACKYFNKAYKLYKNWTLVAASFNMGRKNINKQITRQKSNNYYDLVLGEETSRYVFRILAIKLILSDSNNYGFNFEKSDLYQNIPTYQIEIDTSISDLADFAHHFSINYKILKYFNPWLRENYLNNDKKIKYVIKIPEKGYRQFNFDFYELSADSTENTN